MRSSPLSSSSSFAAVGDRRYLQARSAPPRIRPDCEVQDLFSQQGLRPRAFSISLNTQLSWAALLPTSGVRPCSRRIAKQFDCRNRHLFKDAMYSVAYN